MGRIWNWWSNMSLFVALTTTKIDGTFLNVQWIQHEIHITFDHYGGSVAHHQIKVEIKVKWLHKACKQHKQRQKDKKEKDKKREIHALRREPHGVQLQQMPTITLNLIPTNCFCTNANSKFLRKVWELSFHAPDVCTDRAPINKKSHHQTLGSQKCFSDIVVAVLC